MKIEREITIISGFMGFTIGVCSMMMVNVNKEIIEIERDVVPIHLIQENINTCEDMIEWMNEDIFNGQDSTMFEMYIYNLEQMTEENRYILQTEYDY
jgi:hypothetical protein